MGSDQKGDNPYAKRVWDDVSGAWKAEHDVVPDPGATVPGRYIGPELLEKITTGSFTQADIESFRSGTPVAEAVDSNGEAFDFPDWVSDSKLPVATPAPPRPSKKPKRDLRQMLLAGWLGGVFVGLLIAAILLVMGALGLAFFG